MIHRILFLSFFLISCSAEPVYNPSILMSSAWFENTVLDCILKECYLCRMKVTNNPAVTVFAGTGAASSIDGTIATASFQNPFGIELDSFGNIYVTEQNANKIRKIVTAAGFVTSLSTSFTLGDPAGIKYDSVTGDKYVSCKSSAQIYKINALDQFTLFAGSPVGAAGLQNGDNSGALFNGPFFMDFDRERNLYLGELGNRDIRKFNLNFQSVSTLSGSSLGYQDGDVLTALFKSPIGVVYDRKKNSLLVADIQDHRIRKINLDTMQVSTLLGTGTGASVDGNGTSASFNGPAHIALDNSGTMFVSDSVSNKIRIVDPDLNVTTIAHTFQAIGVVKIDCANQRLLVADSTANQLFEVRFQ
ncbi:hypothetical protein LFX25_04615 [Leptospira sp. FAT2]|uniref:hypothetical protein n=1 Tax=Leptospira sanjuanensis TaxID=2879643 RepID=UPI001EE91880|nr:hypothetical protein [Leptospira sanjuanensis]MCG6167063.1 hypothetical protein [Leptospira sanjuanensis]MCG6192518.1 hypothetical protein [Leptospira sanjuanensis]